MALAVTHVLIAIVILDLFRHYVFGLKKFPRYLVVLGGIGGLLPDTDIPLSWVYNFFTGMEVNFHGTFTHTIIIPIVLLAAALIRHSQKDLKSAKILYVISAGWFIHLVLDCLYGGYRTFLWPFYPLAGFCPEWGLSLHAMSIDALILVFWLVHEEIHHKIKDYI